MNTRNNTPLAEQVKNTLESRMSATKKAEALIKLGLTEFEAMHLAKASIPPTHHPFVFSFGVEIECVGCRFADFRETARNNGLRVYDQFNYNHRDMSVFKLTTDSSINGDYAAECVTPPLNSRTGFSSLKACCKTLSEVGASANLSCGLHVHIGAAALTDEEYVSVFVNYMHLETAIESFLARSRRGEDAQWCESLKPHCWQLERANTKDDVRRALHYRRYHRVNAQAYEAHQTIEFRQHQGTTNYTKISHWVKFLGKLVEFSKTTRLVHDIDRIEDIPFLSDSEKTYFCNRRAEFERRYAR